MERGERQHSNNAVVAALKLFDQLSTLRVPLIEVSQVKEDSTWKGAEGIPTKGIGSNSLNVKKQGKFRVFSGRLQALSVNFHGVFRSFSGCFSYPLCGYLLWTCGMLTSTFSCQCQRRLDDNQNEICIFEGIGLGDRQENRPKMLFFLKMP